MLISISSSAYISRSLLTTAGPQYSEAEVYDIYRLDGTIDGREMMRAARSISSNIALLVPRNADVDQVSPR